MRVLVTGSRDWGDRAKVREELNKALWVARDRYEDLTLVWGHCPEGVDRQAFYWALDWIEKGLDIQLEPHPADWSGPRGKGAGYARNAEMVNLGADLCLAFIQDESAGATHTEQLARKAGIETKTFKRSTKNMAQQQYIPEVQLDGVRVIWRNFEGREEFNQTGNRNFTVVLPPEIAEDMVKQGWSVKSKPPREEGEDTFYYMKVKVSFKFKQPRITLVTKKFDPKLDKQRLMRTLLDEEALTVLDMVEFDNVELILSPSRWTVRGESGVTAYLKTGFFFQHQDALEERYANLPFADEMNGPLAIEGPDPAKDWIDGEVVSEEEDEDPWAPKEIAS
jgi:hypothetical protein